MEYSKINMSVILLRNLGDFDVYSQWFLEFFKVKREGFVMHDQ